MSSFYRFLTVFLAIVGMVFSLGAQEESVRLKLNLDKGDVYTIKGQVESSGHIEPPLLINAMAYRMLGIEQDVSTVENKWNFTLKDDFVTAARIIDVHSDGSSDLEMRSQERTMVMTAEAPGIVRYQVTVNLNSETTVIAATRDGEEVFRQERKIDEVSPIAMTLDQRGKIVKVMGLKTDEIIAKALRNLGDAKIEEKDLVAFIENCLEYYAYPADSIATGDSWNRGAELSLPLAHKQQGEEEVEESVAFKIDANTTFVELKDDIAHIKTKMQAAPSGMKWALSENNFELLIDLAMESESDAGVDLKTGMPKTLAADQAITGMVLCTLPSFGDGVELLPKMAIPVDMKSAVRMEITREHQPHTGEDRS